MPCVSGGTRENAVHVPINTNAVVRKRRRVPAGMNVGVICWRRDPFQSEENNCLPLRAHLQHDRTNISDFTSLQNAAMRPWLRLCRSF